MALIPFYLRRPAAILKMPEAILRGLTPSAFINELTGLGLSYRKTLMLADWRSMSNIQARKDVIKFTRRDRIPTAKEYADIEWFASQEWAYKLKVHSRVMPGEPITDRYIMIESDQPLTPAEMEAQARSRWLSEEKYPLAEIYKITPYEAYHRISSPLSEQ